ncbi:hypothetical protein TBLA_0A00500 [Henningerozyma blattae CBS 6284]|uniref:glucan endo-1,3-beta-D-glucosidase n=1 Tax=Henningerozyma blattae (strain ATCC 34711 / CBS 6284 / DSM 70876 / NBRC 10599 / NRRL Y-10934 / UCD 77-7) TaxID=1071380 RepID=I2GUP8_HENB6|nr:hypothetical protein TBLA_0A00500 [Tetrapisispora blattae CBS 6284]CCH57850.1 hypothetical protein TBLA_0A00500 [Tetrapisispora blattae CBS 6284]
MTKITFLLFLLSIPIIKFTDASSAQAIVYSNVAMSGSYQDITNMDENSGVCSQKSYAVSGNIAPLDEELSVHFRGPIRIVQFGVYSSSGGGTNLKKRDFDESITDKITSSQEGHRHKKPHSSNSLIQIINDQKNFPSITSLPKDLFVNKEVSSSSWSRIAYYTPGTSSNCVFMNHQGGSGSGTFSIAFGNSISYASSDGKSCASSPQTLNDVTLGSNVEVIIFSSTQCSSNDCGYCRSNIPAYHGFGGATKMFVFEFSMPHDSGGSTVNQDMPAVWLLNAKIPRTLQYGNSQCSCWATGCGELDLFEIISSGSNDLTTTLHDGQGKPGSAQGGGGSGSTFSRPTQGTKKYVVIFNGNDKSIHLVELDDGEISTFGGTISGDQVSGWLSKTGAVVNLS